MSSPKSLFCITDGQGILKICMYHWEAKEIIQHFGNPNLSIVRYDLVESLEATEVKFNSTTVQQENINMTRTTGLTEAFKKFKSNLNPDARTNRDYSTVESILETLEFNMGYVIKIEDTFGTIGLQSHNIDNVKDSYKISKACIEVLKYYCNQQELKHFTRIEEFMGDVKAYYKDVKKLTKGEES